MFALVLCTALAAAGPLEESPSYQEGLSLYQDLEFEDAIERFRAAALEEGRSDEERAKLLVWESMSRAGVGDDEGARAAARRALALDLDVAPPEIAPPKVRGFLEEMRPEVEAELQAAAAPVDAAPADPAPAAAPVAEELPMMLIGGGALAGLGVVGLGAAGLFAALTAASMTTATDPEAFQIDASNAVEAANIQAITAAVLGAGGVVLAGAGAAMVALDVMEE